MKVISKEEFDEIHTDPNRQIQEVKKIGKSVSTVTLFEKEKCVAKKIITLLGTQHLGQGVNDGK